MWTPGILLKGDLAVFSGASAMLDLHGASVEPRRSSNDLIAGRFHGPAFAVPIRSFI
jgi:hypothetical protein